MSVGIYCYKDSKNDDAIVYIGKDAHIDKNNRFNYHKNPKHYDLQQINRVLQNNPNRYKYEVLKSWEFEEYPENFDKVLEIIYIRRYDPKFNYTIGGDGIRGFKHTNETKEKISKSLEGRCGEECGAWKDYPRIIKRGFEKNGKQKYALISNGRCIKVSVHLDRLEAYLESIIKSQEFDWKNYPRIVKHGFQNGKKRYALIYEGETILQSTNLDKLELEFDKLKNK